MSGRVRTAVTVHLVLRLEQTRSTLGRGASRPTGTDVPKPPGIRSEAAGRGVVLDAVEVVVEDLTEHRLVRCGVREEGHRRAQLLRVDRAEHPVGVGGVEAGECPRALDQPPAERGVSEVGPGLVQAGDREPLRHPAAPEPGDLREDEPHPVGALLAGPQLGERLVVGLGLGVEEPLEVVGIAHPGSLPHPAGDDFGTAGWSYRVWTMWISPRRPPKWPGWSPASGTTSSANRRRAPARPWQRCSTTWWA